MARSDAALDARTIAGKELREILTRGGTGSMGRGLLGMLAFPVVVGAALGILAGGTLGGARIALFPVALLAMGTAGGLAPDAVAGERERHTLETLLATPASDVAILGGKLAAVVGFSWTLALCELLAVTVSAAVTRGSLGALGPALLSAIVVLALLEALMTATSGMILSVRAPTVRAAQRRMAQVSLLASVVASGANFVVVSRGSVATMTTVVGLAACDGALIVVARHRFHRPRLILD